MIYKKQMMDCNCVVGRCLFCSLFSFVTGRIVITQ
ncbi:unnamed protein product [Taenia asiatica]|uniref:Uncharacterized protein n=1 Tax=Taenia asiatica TaxID=60517 RepID=A0A3P6Q009_TAEAS|nr:unnamed protein product [Taenia asiatica]